MNTAFSEIEIWFTDQNNNALEIEDNVNISLIINTRSLHTYFKNEICHIIEDMFTDKNLSLLLEK